MADVRPSGELAGLICASGTQKMTASKIHHVSIQDDTADAESDTVDSEYARHAAAFAAARKRKASYHYQGKRRAANDLHDYSD